MARRPTTKLKLVPATLSPERAALAAEIERNKHKAEEIAALEADFDAARAEWRAADDRKFALQAELRELEENAAAHAVAALRGGKKKVRTPKIIEAEIADTVADREQAELARDTLEKELNQARGAASHTWHRDALIAAVIRGAPEVHALIEKVDALQRELAPLVAQLLFLDSESAIFDKPSSSGSWVSGSRDEDIVQTVFRSMSPPRSWSALIEGQSQPWRDTFAALQQDASAPLPQ